MLMLMLFVLLVGVASVVDDGDDDAVVTIAVAVVTIAVVGIAMCSLKRCY